LLAGRKLLLADDSITIQRVVDLTFADEGVEVLSVSNGRDAIDRLPEFLPDVVLADIFMPQASGYEVCEFIKQNEQLKHIPVMLLVGSFEPFDEAEARRVGADDTLTKPFQSIRNLIDKVGALVAGRPPDEQIPTAELPHAEMEESEPELLTEAQIDFVTADTQPLPIEMRHMVEETAARRERQEVAQPETETKVGEGLMGQMGQMGTQDAPTGTEASERRGDIGNTSGDMPLDLGGLESVPSSDPDEFVLDIDLDEAPDASAYQPSAYVRPPVYRSPAKDWKTAGAGSKTDVATVDQFARTQEFPAAIGQAAKELKPEKTFEAVSPTAGSKSSETSSQTAESVSLEGLSPELIDSIARRAVEQLSEKVVREIAWEVVPDLAELLIKRQLEENKS